MKLGELTETISTVPLSSRPVKAWIDFLTTNGKAWTDAPGGRKIVKATYDGIDGYGLVDVSGDIVSIATLKRVVIQGKHFYQLHIISTSETTGGNFYPQLTLLWTIKEHIGLPLIDYGAQSEQGTRFVRALSKTKRFNLYWFNIETGDTAEYNEANDSHEDNLPYRGSQLTPWRVVVEHSEAPSFPKIVSESILNHSMVFEIFEQEDNKCL
jgi:hypothetical protein